MNKASCVYCKQIIEIVKQEPRGSIKSHGTSCKARKIFLNEKLTKDFLQYNYIECRKSAKQISDENRPISVTAVIEKLKEHGFETRTLKETTLMPETRNKYKATYKEKTGFEHNFCKNSPSRIDWETNMFLTEGIINVFQRSEVKKQINISIFNNDSSKQKTMSSIHKKVHEYLLKEDFNVKVEKVIKNKEHLLRFYDLHIIGTNKIIEINGDFWHANPLKYKENDILTFPGVKIPAKTIWERDKLKINLALEYGYEVLVLWERDINKKFEECKKIVNGFINGDINETANFYQIYKKDNT